MATFNDLNMENSYTGQCFVVFDSDRDICFVSTYFEFVEAYCNRNPGAYWEESPLFGKKA